MTIANYDIVGSYNNQRVSEIDAERSINVFEYRDSLGKKDKSLISTSGLVNTQTSFVGAAGGYRVQFVFNDDEYDVIGNNVYRINGSGSAAIVGTIGTAIGYVGVDANTYQILFVDGSGGYVYDTIANTFTQITDTSFPSQPLDCCYLDGFFIVVNGNTNNFQLSSFNQGLVWGSASDVFTADDTVGNNWLIVSSTANYQTGVEVTLSTTGSLPMPLNNTDNYFVIRVDATHIRLALTAEDARNNIPIVLTSNGTPVNTITSLGQLQQGSMTSHPGTIVGCETLHRRLFLFSQFYTEVWENSGIGTNLPFRRNNSLLIEYGTPSAASKAVSFDIMCFLSQDRGGLGSVMQVNGVQPVPISTRALDFQLAQYAALDQVSDCTAFLVKENGLIFYRMNFTEANHTFVYNVTQSNPAADETKFWHEEEVLNGDRHPAQTHAYFNGINYVGSYNSPVRYALDTNVATNDGDAIRRARIGRPFVPPGYQRTRIDRFQLDLLQGNQPAGTTDDTSADLLAETGDMLLTEGGQELLLDRTTVFGPSVVPYVFLSISKDGGQTYGYRQRAPMGAIGNRTFRTLWRKLGTIPRGQAYVPKIEFYNDAPFIILGAAWFYEVMPE